MLFEDWAEDWKPENAKKITNAAITKIGPNFDAILASNDGTAGGAIQALTEEGLAGGTSRKDLEQMFQLVYLTFTAPRADPVAFRVMNDQLKVTLANQAAIPDQVFDDALEAALTQNHLRAQPLTPARLSQMNLDKSLAFYKDRFADASDFTFVFVGSFDLATMKPLVERYLGSLPALQVVGELGHLGLERRHLTRKTSVLAIDPFQFRAQFLWIFEYRLGRPGKRGWLGRGACRGRRSGLMPGDFIPRYKLL